MYFYQRIAGAFLLIVFMNTFLSYVTPGDVPLWLYLLVGAASVAVWAPFPEEW